MAPVPGESFDGTNPLQGFSLRADRLPRGFFGPSRSEVWSAVADEIGGFYASGGLFESDQLIFNWQGIPISLDLSTTTSTTTSTKLAGGLRGMSMPEGDDDLLAILLFGAIAGSSESTETRMKALVPIPDSFRLTVYRQGIFSSIGKAFGMEDIAIGDAKFDEQFVVKSSDAATARRFLSDPYLRDLIDCQRNGVIEVQSQISFECPGAMKNPDRIVRLFELFIELIRQSRSLSD